MKMKKVVALLLASVMTLSMAITSFAADGDPSKEPVVPEDTKGDAQNNSGNVKVGDTTYYIGATVGKDGNNENVVAQVSEEYKKTVENVIKTDETIKKALANPSSIGLDFTDKDGKPVEVKEDDIEVFFTSDYVLKDEDGNILEGNELTDVLASKDGVTFEVPEGAIQKPGEGQLLYALHFITEGDRAGQWEILAAELGADGTTVTVKANSLSPFTFFVGPTGLVAAAPVTDEPTTTPPATDDTTPTVTPPATDDTTPTVTPPATDDTTPTPTVTTTPAPGQNPPTYHEPPKHAYDPDAAIKGDSTDKGNSNTNTNNKNNSATTSTSTTSAAKVSPKTGQR